MNNGIKGRYNNLIAKAAGGSRPAAKRLILEGFYPQTWDSDDDATLDRVIDSAKRQVSA